MIMTIIITTTNTLNLITGLITTATTRHELEDSTDLWGILDLIAHAMPIHFILEVLPT